MKRLIYIFLLFHIAFFNFQSALGQGTIRGTLFDEANGEAIPFANVVLEGTKMGCATDLSGFFLINKIPDGTYTLRVRYVGYEDYSQEITVAGTRPQTLTIRLKPSSKILSEVEIKASKIEEKRMQTQVSVEKVTSAQIQQMPSIGGQADIAQFMQVLPGVSSTGDQGGQLYIRGGSMIQNLCLLDGMIVYNPFHSIGLYSIFETDVILNADIYTGGFGAEYGGRLSSVMDITTRDGNKRRHSGKIGLNTFGASVILEGPLKRETERSKSTITYLVTAKNSYLSWSSKKLYPYVEGGLPFDFMDVYGKLSINSGTGSKINLFGFRYDDKVTAYQGLADYHWQNYGAGTNFTLVTGSSAILDGSIAYSNYYITLDDGSSDNKYSEIGGFNMNLQITNFFGNNKLKYGLSMESYHTNYRFVNQYGYSTTQEKPSVNLALFATYKINTGKLLLDPGVRLMYYATLGHVSPEPRLAVKYNINENMRVKFAGGFYSQIFLDARSDNDIVNLFTGFLTGSSDLSITKSFLGKEVSTYTQKAKHAVLGVEYNLGEHVTLNAEGYFKYFDQLINANRNKMYDPSDEAYQSGPYAKAEYLMTDFIVEKGFATGFDVSVQADLERLYLWATYSLGYVQRTDEEQSYNPHYDRRHTVNILGTYALGSQREWELSTRWSFGSGFPFTQTQGVFQSLVFGSGIVSDYTQENGHYGIHYAELYAGRLPNYHRLDLGVKRKISIGKRSMLELSLSATNVYSRQNIFYYNRATHKRVNQLPFLASFGAVFSF